MSNITHLYFDVPNPRDGLWQLTVITDDGTQYFYGKTQAEALWKALGKMVWGAA